MKKNILSILLFFFIGLSVKAQYNTFQTGGGYHETGNSVTQTNDGGLLFLGSSEFNPGDQEMVLEKYGYPQWVKKYGEGLGSCVIQTSDGGYAIIGSAFIKINSNGDTLWTKNIGGRTIHQTNDGGYIISGSKLPPYWNGGSIIKTNSLGNIVWSKKFHDLYANASVQTNDNGYILSGYQADYASTIPSSGVLIKLDNSGNILWEKRYFRTNYNTGLESVLQTADGGFLSVGDCLIKTDGNGNLIVAKNIWGRSMQHTNDGGFIILGSGSIAGGTGLIKIDSNLIPIWSHEYTYSPDSNCPSDFAYGCVIQTNDGGYAMNVTLQGGCPINPSSNFIKTDPLGNVGCYEGSFITPDSTIAISDSTINLIDSSGISFTPMIINVVSIPIANDSSFGGLCFTAGINKYNNESTLTIAPNPFTSKTTISFNEEQKHTSIKITDVLGKEIKTINFSGKQCTIEKGEMLPGIYFLQVVDSQKTIVNKKIVVQ